MLKPGALYAECAVAPIRLPKTMLAPLAEEMRDGGEDGPDDGELGGTVLGMEDGMIMSGKP